jgi:hypothetical protein
MGDGDLLGIPSLNVQSCIHVLESVANIQFSLNKAIPEGSSMAPFCNFP